MATEKRLISVDDAMDAFADECTGYEFSAFFSLHNIDDILDSVPTVDAVEVVHSKWDTVFYERNGTLASYSHLCPECKYFYKNVRFKGHNYCPNCGAKMDGDGNG